MIGRRKAGRKPLLNGQHRVAISARVSPLSAEYIRENKLKLGLFIDSLVKSKLEPSTDTTEAEIQEAYDVIGEQARGLYALIIERGTDHLTEDEIELLSQDFSNLINHYRSTFIKK